MPVFGAPPPQQHIRVAVEKALAALQDQSDDQLRWLGAVPTDRDWRLRTLDDILVIDPATAQVLTSAGAVVGPTWKVLVLHYLAIANRADRLPPSLTFADLPSGRGYAGVYQNRVIRRLCATAGRDEATLRRAAAELGARPAEGGDAAFDFHVFPSFTIRLIWHKPDEEFGPSATILLPQNAEEWFCTEDLVVLCESVVARLSGRPF